uniref:Uncharacterized protein n=1 Tax=Myoviridae sp. ctpvf97 TaxID=2825176 RepID=A0A8S5TW27_9CAUD|nr:MAG TPA: hypothetical protein [Myoviridae sp. ctpvf97]
MKEEYHEQRKETHGRRSCGRCDGAIQALRMAAIIALSSQSATRMQLPA